jgi:hypothetical protein
MTDSIGIDPSIHRRLCPALVMSSKLADDEIILMHAVNLNLVNLFYFSFTSFGCNLGMLGNRGAGLVQAAGTYSKAYFYWWKILHLSMENNMQKTPFYARMKLRLTMHASE